MQVQAQKSNLDRLPAQPQESQVAPRPGAHAAAPLEQLVASQDAHGARLGVELEVFVPRGIKGDSIQLSQDAQHLVTGDAVRGEFAKQVAQQFNPAGEIDDFEHGFDFSVEATTARIARFATGIFQAWREREASGESNLGLGAFGERVQEGVRLGFREAIDQLQAAGASERSLERVRAVAGEFGSKLEAALGELRGQVEPDPVLPQASPKTQGGFEAPRLGFLEA